MRYLILVLGLLAAAPVWADPPDAGVPAPTVVVPSDVAEPAPAPDPAPPSEVVPAPAVVTPEVDAGAAPVAPVSAPAEPSVVVPSAPAAPVSALPAPPTMTDAEAGEAAGKLIDAAQKGAWPVVVGFVLLLLVWGLNKLGLAAKIGRAAVPWMTVLLGGAAMVGVSLVEGSDVAAALKFGLMEGGVAVALWELVLKRFVSKADGSPRQPA